MTRASPVPRSAFSRLRRRRLDRSKIQEYVFYSCNVFCTVNASHIIITIQLYSGPSSHVLCSTGKSTYRSDVPLGLFPLQLRVEIAQQRVELCGQVHVLVLIPGLCGLAAQCAVSFLGYSCGSVLSVPAVWASFGLRGRIGVPGAGGRGGLLLGWWHNFVYRACVSSVLDVLG